MTLLSDERLAEILRAARGPEDLLRLLRAAHPRPSDYESPKPRADGGLARWMAKGWSIGWHVLPGVGAAFGDLYRLLAPAAFLGDFGDSEAWRARRKRLDGLADAYPTITSGDADLVDALEEVEARFAELFQRARDAEDALEAAGYYFDGERVKERPPPGKRGRHRLFLVDCAQRARAWVRETEGGGPFDDSVIHRVAEILGPFFPDEGVTSERIEAALTSRGRSRRR